MQDQGGFRRIPVVEETGSHDAACCRQGPMVVPFRHPPVAGAMGAVGFGGQADRRYIREIIPRIGTFPQIHQFHQIPGGMRRGRECLPVS